MYFKRLSIIIADFKGKKHFGNNYNNNILSFLLLFSEL